MYIDPRECGENNFSTREPGGCPSEIRHIWWVGGKETSAVGLFVQDRSKSLVVLDLHSVSVRVLYVEGSSVSLGPPSGGGVASLYMDTLSFHILGYLL